MSVRCSRPISNRVLVRSPRCVPLSLARHVVLLRRALRLCAFIESREQGLQGLLLRRQKAKSTCLPSYQALPELAYGLKDLTLISMHEFEINGDSDVRERMASSRHRRYSNICSLSEYVSTDVFVGPA